MRSLLYSLSLVFILFSCNNGATSETEAAKDPVKDLKLEVIKIHDDVMAKMDDTGSLMTTLKKSDRSNPQDSLDIMKGYTALKTCRDGMMTWMHEFKSPDEQEWTDDEKLEYLNQEKTKISKLATDVEEALGFSNQLVSRLNSK